MKLIKMVEDVIVKDDRKMFGNVCLLWKGCWDIIYNKDVLFVGKSFLYDFCMDVWFFGG